MKTLKIGNIKIKNNLVLAPMAGFSDLPFRLICKKLGAGLTVSEMISINGFYFNSKKTPELVKTCEEEKPFAIQLFGSEISRVKNAVEKIKNNCDIIDFNLGCPVKKIVTQKAGSWLLNYPEKVSELIKEIKRNTEKPVTAKIRLGKDEKHLTYLKVVEAIEKAGADAIFIHGRTIEQGYSGDINYEAIAEINENVSIPVIGNGNIIDLESAKKMLQTKVDGLMIGRGALKNPFLFKQIFFYLRNKRWLDINKKDKINFLFDYMELCDKYNLKSNEYFFRAKQHAIYLTKELENSRKLRERIMKAKNVDELKTIIKS